MRERLPRFLLFGIAKGKTPEQELWFQYYRLVLRPIIEQPSGILETPFSMDRQQIAACLKLVHHILYRA